MMICETMSACDILTHIQHLKAINILEIESLFSKSYIQHHHCTTGRLGCYYKNVLFLWKYQLKLNLVFELKDQEIFKVLCGPLRGEGVENLNSKNPLSWPQIFC